MTEKKLSTTYKLLRKLGFNYSEEEYGQVSLWRVIKQFFGNMRRKRLLNMMDWAILEPFNPRKLRPIILRKLGCKVGKNVFVGDNVRVDMGHAELITIDDYAHITENGFFIGNENGTGMFTNILRNMWMYDDGQGTVHFQLIPDYCYIRDIRYDYLSQRSLI